MGLWDRLHKDDDGAHSPTVGEAVAAAQEEQAKAVWGRPSRCPACGGVGYLDRIDVVDRVMEEHCTECFHKWTVAEADTVKA